MNFIHDPATTRTTQGLFMGSGSEVVSETAANCGLPGLSCVA